MARKASPHPGFNKLAIHGKQHPGFKPAAAHEAKVNRGVAPPQPAAPAGPPPPVAPVAPIGPPQMPGACPQGQGD